jgi:putative tricarboxylic transport membrane protein
VTLSPREMNDPPDGTTPSGATGRLGIHSDLAIAIGIIAFCAIVYVLTTTFLSMPTAMQSMGMGPEVFPRLLLGLLVVLAGVLALFSRGSSDEPREPIAPMVYWTALAMVAFMGVLWLAGMAVAMVVGFVGLGALWGERRWALLVGSGVILSIAIYFTFVKGFGVPLPRGVIGDWFY